MNSETYIANCKKCGETFEYGLFSRTYPYCANCAAELDDEALARISETEAAWTENWPDRLVPTTPEDEVRHHEAYTRDDHRKNVDDYESRRKP